MVMIDVNKCTYEESFTDEFGSAVHYFIYPKEGLDEYGDFYGEEDYGNVVSACLSLTVEPDGEYYMQLSPTVEEDNALMDVDWRDLYEGIHYTIETVKSLLKVVPYQEGGWCI